MCKCKPFYELQVCTKTTFVCGSLHCVNLIFIHDLTKKGILLITDDFIMEIESYIQTLSLYCFHPKQQSYRYNVSMYLLRAFIKGVHLG